MARHCRVKTGRINTGATYIDGGDWQEHYAATYCNAEIVNGQCPRHPKKKRRPAPTPRRRK